MVLLYVAGCGKFETNPVRLCAWRGRIPGSECPTRCQWQCNVARNLGCGAPGCEAACEASARGGSECSERALRYFGCMAWTQRTKTTCCESRITFWLEDDTCVDEHRAALSACGGEPLTISLLETVPMDGGLASVVGSQAARARTTDAGIPQHVGESVASATHGDAGAWLTTCPSEQATTP